MPEAPPGRGDSAGEPPGHYAAAGMDGSSGVQTAVFVKNHPGDQQNDEDDIFINEDRLDQWDFAQAADEQNAYDDDDANVLGVGVLEPFEQDAEALVPAAPAIPRSHWANAAAQVFPDDLAKSATPASMAARIVSINASTWAGVRDFTCAATPTTLIIVAQEVKLTAAEIPAAQRAMERMGWRALFASADEGPQGHPSAGVAILARSSLGLRDPVVVVPHRVLAATVDLAPGRPIAIMSLYGHSSVGPSAANRGLLAAAGQAAAAYEAEGVPIVVGGDWNLGPAEVAKMGWPRQAGLQLVYSDLRRPTCRKKGCRGRVIDFFAVTPRLADAVNGVRVLAHFPLAPHCPVALLLPPDITKVKVRSLHTPRALGRERVVGPIAKPPDYHHAANLAQSALDAAMWSSSSRTVRRAMDAAVRSWSHTVEQEFANILGIEVPAGKGARGRCPREVWKTVMPPRPRSSNPGISIAYLAKWAADARCDLREAVARAAASAAAGCSDAEELVSEARLLAQDLQMVGAEVLADTAGEQDSAEQRVQRASARSSIARAVGWAQAVADAEWIDADAVAVFTAAVASECAEEGDARTKDRLQSARAASWTDWARRSALNGGRAAHAWTKVPTEWVPNTCKTVGGQTSAFPQDLADDQGNKFSELWQGVATPVPKMLPPLEQRRFLPQPRPEDIRRACRQWSLATAVGTDGFRPRHFAWLCDEALQVLADLFSAMEAARLLPPQWEHLRVPLIPKKANGYRAIGIMVAPMRVWGKLRRSICDEWERKHSRPYFASAAGKSPLDPVWRQALLAEGAVASGSVAAAVFHDVAAFFDSIPHDKLRRAAADAGFDEVVLDVGLAIYTGPRHLEVGSAQAPTVFAQQGVVAGCALCTTLAKVILLAVMDDLVLRFPNVDWTLFVDDVGLAARGDQQDVVDLLVAASSALEEAVAALGCPLATGKTAVAASTCAAARRLALHLDVPFSHDAGQQAVFLGADFAPGVRRAVWSRRSYLGSRLRRTAARRGRVRRLRAAGGRRVNCLAAAGLVPQGSFGACVTGFSDQEWLSLRRSAAAALGTSAGGRSLSRLLALEGDPSAKAMIAPITRWASECWASRDHQDGALTPDEMLQLWRSCLRRGCRAWRDSHGPADATMLTLRRLGWTWSQPWAIAAPDGRILNFFHMSPKLIEATLVREVQALHERAVARSLGRDRVSVAAVRRLLRGTGLTALEKGSLQSVVCGAVWTGKRLQDAGYAGQASCPLCKSGKDDTIFHRAWECEATADLRQDCPQLAARARAAGPDSALYTLALAAHPEAVGVPRPELSKKVKLQFVGEAASTTSFFAAGPVFSDGSCVPHVEPALARAGWAVVQIDSAGKLVRAVLGPVAAEWPQTAQAAEYAAAQAFATFADPGSFLVSDCLGVVNAVREEVRLLWKRQMHGGTLRTAFSYEAARDGLHAAVKVKAHQSVTAGPQNCPKWHFAAGNAVADKQANAARALQPPASPTVLATADFQVAEALRVGSIVARATARWPSAGERRQPSQTAVAQREAAAARRAAAKQARRSEEQAQAKANLATHSWQGQQCAVCHVSRSRGALAACEGRPAALPQLLASAVQLHHKMHIGEAVAPRGARMPIAACLACGGWSQTGRISRRSKLASECSGCATGAGPDVVARLSAGWHPSNRLHNDVGVVGLLPWRPG